MRPFNLEAALSGEAVCYRSGEPVSFLLDLSSTCPKFDKTRDPILAFNEEGISSSHQTNGKYFKDRSTSPYDLFMAPVKKYAWLNLYPGGKAFYYSSEEEAQDAAGPQCLATLPIEWEE